MGLWIKDDDWGAIAIQCVDISRPSSTLLRTKDLRADHKIHKQLLSGKSLSPISMCFFFHKHIFIANLFSNLGLQSVATVIMCVIPTCWRDSKLNAQPTPPIKRFSRTWPGMLSYFISWVDNSTFCLSIIDLFGEGSFSIELIWIIFNSI